MALTDKGKYDKYGSPGSPLRESAILGDVEKQSGSPYKAYVALISQDNEDAPVAVVLNENDGNFLGNIVWTYDVPGHYYGFLAGAFNQKTVIFFQNNQNCFSSAARFGDAEVEDYIEIATFDVAYAPLNSKMYKGTIEVRVYQN